MHLKIPVNNSLISYSGILDTEGNSRDIPHQETSTYHSISGLKDGDRVIIHDMGRDLQKMNRYFSKAFQVVVRNSPALRNTPS